MNTNSNGLKRPHKPTEYSANVHNSMPFYSNSMHHVEANNLQPNKTHSTINQSVNSHKSFQDLNAKFRSNKTISYSEGTKKKNSNVINLYFEVESNFQANRQI